MLHFAAAILLGQAKSGDAVIKGKTKDSEIVITTTTRCAGAIDSLKWRGKEFINSADHGRQLQSASNFDFGSTIQNETFNPTEAGSRKDGAGKTSRSVLEFLKADKNVLETRSRMAFWLEPGEFSGPNLAKNATVVSNHILSKRVVIGALGRPHLVSYDVTFELPKAETHMLAVFESLTGYMPPEFNTFYTFNPRWKALTPLSDGPGEQPIPIIFTTKDHAFAMGIFSPETREKGYGRWRFEQERVVKWNCVFRIQSPKPGGDYKFRHYFAVGTLEDVCRELSQPLP